MRVRVLGAGIVGLSVADELLRRGHEVTVVDPAPGRGASYAAAGMLSPAGEVWHGEEALLSLGRRSLALWPSYAARLGVPLHTTGTLLVGRDHGDLQQVERQAALLALHGTQVELLSRRELLDREPTLTSRVAGGLLLPDDHSVDPRTVVAALTRVVEQVSTSSTTDVVETTVADASGLDDARSSLLDHPVVVATGATLPEPWAHLVRGIRGEVVRVRTDDPPAHTVRGWVHGEPVYAVPRAASGEVVIGATSEEHDEPPVATVGGVARLLDAARSLLPGLDRAELTEAIARDRPGTPDNLPLVGPSGVAGTVLAAGLFRHGVLLAPLVAQLVADHLETGAVEAALDPRRFANDLEGNFV